MNYQALHVDNTAHPLVKLLFYHMRMAERTMSWMAEQCGFTRATISRWKPGKMRYGNDPNLTNLDAAFRVLGKRVVVIDTDLLPDGVHYVGDELTVRLMLSNAILKARAPVMERGSP